MASFEKDRLGQVGTHTVGQINSWTIDTVINGAIVTEVGGIDNFTLGQVFFKDGEAHVKQATADAKAHEMVLIATPEVRLEGEPLCNFYNAKDERATCVILKHNLSFETSAIDVKTVAVGDVVKWDATTKAFVKETGDIATLEKAFQVTDIETEEFFSIDAKELARLTVIK